MNKYTIFWPFFSIFFIQSSLSGITKTPDEPQVYFGSKYVVDPQISAQCNHFQCCGCGLFSFYTTQVASSQEEAQWLCPFNKKKLKYLTLSTLFRHIKDTLEHFFVCMGDTEDNSYRFSTFILENIGFNITQYFVEYRNSKVFDTILHEAAKDGNIRPCKYILNLFLQSGFSVNIKAKYYCFATALHVAAHYGNTKCVQELLKAKADPNLPDQDNLTPVHKAWLNGHLDIVYELIESANKRLTDGEGNTYLHYAATFGQLTLTQYLMNHVKINAQNKYGDTALHIAVLKNNIPIVATLLKHKKIKTSIKNRRQKTALDLAIDAGNQTIINLFFHNP